jgi:hypothetical protein
MKYLMLLIISFICCSVYGQKITGVVIDKTTKQPVYDALISLGNAKTRTNVSGVFEIPATGLNDSLKVAHFAYEPYRMAISKNTTVLRIELEPKVTKLNEVTIRGSKDFKKDSIENRLAYAKQFNYKGPTVMDAFTGNPDKGPGELISINPLILIAALTKKSTTEYKFNKILIRDEHEQFIDEHFNKGIVGRITDLKGDTLSAFLMQYRPTYEFVKKSTEYDMEVYIRQSYKKFKAEGISVSNPFHDATNENGDGVKLN